MGQSEIEVAGLADTTIVVLEPEAGDEVQTMKAGLMEIADIFVVNKSDRPEAGLFLKNLRSMLAPAFHHKQKEIPVLATVASQNKGIPELWEAIVADTDHAGFSDRKLWLQTERAWQLIQQKRMRDISKTGLREQIKNRMEKGSFNLYEFVSKQ